MAGLQDILSLSLSLSLLLLPPFLSPISLYSVSLLLTVSLSLSFCVSVSLPALTLALLFSALCLSLILSSCKQGKRLSTQASLTQAPDLLLTRMTFCSSLQCLYAGPGEQPLRHCTWGHFYTPPVTETRHFSMVNGASKLMTPSLKLR